MSWFRNLLRREDAKYVLRAKRDNTWEDVAVYDRKVDQSELRELLEELREAGYEYATLYRKSSSGTTQVWNRRLTVKKKGDVVEEVANSVDKLTRVIEVVDRLRGHKDPLEEIDRAMSIVQKLSEIVTKVKGEEKRMGIEDIIGSIVYYEKLKGTLSKYISSHKSEESFSDFLLALSSFITALKQAPQGQPIPLPQQLQAILSQQQTQQVQQQQQIAPKQVVQPEPVNSEPLPVEGEGEELPEEVLEAKAETLEELAPPCVKGEEEEECA